MWLLLMLMSFVTFGFVYSLSVGGCFDNKAWEGRGMGC